MSARKLIYAVCIAYIIYSAALWISKIQTDRCALEIEEWLADEFAPRSSGAVLRIPLRTDMAIGRFESSTTYKRWRKFVRVHREKDWQAEEVIKIQEPEELEAQKVGKENNRAGRPIIVEIKNDNMLNGGVRQVGIRPMGSYYFMRIISDERGGHLIILVESSFFGFKMLDQWSLKKYLWQVD